MKLFNQYFLFLLPINLLYTVYSVYSFISNNQMHNQHKQHNHKQIANDKIITNMDFPSCKNCKYFQPSNFDSEFASSLTKCNKFGTKDIITDKITYTYADSIRKDESKCGKEGKYFEKENFIQLKIFIHKFISSSPYIISISLIVLSVISNVYLSKK
jgi:hypothetical protein